MDNTLLTSQQGLNQHTTTFSYTLPTQASAGKAEPPIDIERQQYLTACLSIIPDGKSGLYPFKEIKLTRADVEWLLENHEDRRGPVDWSDKSQHPRIGLDLRGADLRRANLCNLPLARMLGGRSWAVQLPPAEEQRNKAPVHLEGADLGGAHLEEAFLGGAHLEEAFLGGAHLEGASLADAHLEGASLAGAHLEGANLAGAHLEGANLAGAHLEGANLAGAHLEGASLTGAHLEGASLAGAHLAGKPAHADYLKRVRYWDRDILLPANLQEAFFDSRTVLKEIILGEERYGFVSLADVHWGKVNLSVVEWESVTMLGDEYKARQTSWLYNYLQAVRAYRQLATELRDQGLYEPASRFAYRAESLQRRVLWRQMLQLRRQGRRGIWKLLQKGVGYLLSWLLNLLVGYGYKPLRGLIACLLVIGFFTVIYCILGGVYGPHVTWEEWLSVSLTAFHGWIFAPGSFKPGSLLAFVSGIEAFVGLLVGVCFIAALIRRFPGK